MKKLTAKLIQPGRILGLLFLAASAAFSGTITVVLSVGPDGPSFNQYVQNAEYALEHNLTTYGDPTLPSYYTRADGPINAGALLNTSDGSSSPPPSWMGNPSPTGAYANETGNGLFFGLIISSITQFSLSDVSWSGPAEWGTFSLSGLSFNDHTVGIDTTNLLSPIRYDAGHPGDNTTLINTLFYSGVEITHFSSDLAADLQTYAFGAATITYDTFPAGSTNNFSGSSSFDSQIPEPGTLVLLSLGFGAMLWFRRNTSAARSK